MTTKYIVNNLTGQTITGNIIINGDLSVTGTTTIGLATYKALLTQTGTLVGTSLNDFNQGLIIGETYTITNYVSGDDFSNIANVQSGVINETGCVFITTGNTPTIWINGSELTSNGDLVVDVIENTLGYDMYWETFLSPGTYVGFPNNIGPKYNNFPRETTSITTQQTILGAPFLMDYIKYYTQTTSFTAKDDMISLGVWDSDFSGGVNNTLYYTPIEIKIKKDLDTTPVVLSGTIIDSFPFNYPSIDLICNGNYVEAFVGNNVTVNNISELITELNTNQETSYLGTYSEDGLGGVLLTMPTNLVNRFCSNGTLTFEVFAD